MDVHLHALRECPHRVSSRNLTAKLISGLLEVDIVMSMVAPIAQ